MTNLDFYRKVALLHETNNHDRLINLRMKYRENKNRMVKECLRKQMEHILSDCKDKKWVEEFNF